MFKLSLFNNEGKVKDPVCNMSVDKNKTAFSSVYKEKLYYFCSENCKIAFDINKEVYA